MFDRLTKMALGLAVPLALMTAGPALRKSAIRRSNSPRRTTRVIRR